MSRLLVRGQCLAPEVPEKIADAVLAARMIERIRMKNAPLAGGATVKNEGRCHALRTA